VWEGNGYFIARRVFFGFSLINQRIFQPFFRGARCGFESAHKEDFFLHKLGRE